MNEPRTSLILDSKTFIISRMIQVARMVPLGMDFLRSMFN